MTGIAAITTGLDIIALPAKLQNAAGSAVTWCLAHPLAGVLAVSVLANAWQYHTHNVQTRALATCATQTAAMAAASKQALTQAETRNAALARQYQENAHAADMLHEKLAQNSAALADYIRTHSLHPAITTHSASPVPATAPPERTTVSPDPAATTTVAADPIATDASTLKICDADYTYAAAAYAWAQGMTRKGTP